MLEENKNTNTKKREITITVDIDFDISEHALKYMHNDMSDLVQFHRKIFRKSKNTPEMDLLDERIRILEQEVPKEYQTYDYKNGAWENIVKEVRDTFIGKNRTQEVSKDYIVASEFHAKEQLKQFISDNTIDLNKTVNCLKSVRTIDYVKRKKQYEKFLQKQLAERYAHFQKYGGLDPQTYQVNKSELATCIGLDTYEESESV